MLPIQVATLGARARTGRHISSAVSKGSLIVVEITKEGRKTVVTHLSKPGTMTQAIEFMGDL